MQKRHLLEHCGTVVRASNSQSREPKLESCVVIMTFGKFHSLHIAQIHSAVFTSEHTAIDSG